MDSLGCACSRSGLFRIPLFVALCLTAATADPLLAATVQAASSGAIEGTVEMRISPPRRTANRYASGRVQAAKPVQQLPAVVYLRGGATGGRTPPAVETMAQRDTAFATPVLMVQVGTTVEFPNGDPFFHNVFSYSQVQRFDLGRYPAGQTKSVMFEEPGIVKVYCEVHDFMRAAILVLENPYHTVVAADGSFSINDVPPGDYELVAWQADLDEQVVSVTVRASGTEQVAVTLR